MHELRLVSWFEQNEPIFSAAVKAAIINWCSLESAERAAKFDFGEYFPVVIDDDELRENIGLYAINVHQVDADGVPLVGYEFGCEWEQEHGLGVLMHGTRVVDVGSADTAFLLWIAEEDAKTIGARSI